MFCWGNGALHEPRDGDGDEGSELRKRGGAGGIPFLMVVSLTGRDVRVEIRGGKTGNFTVLRADLEGLSLCTNWGKGIRKIEKGSRCVLKGKNGKHTKVKKTGRFAFRTMG